MNESSTRGIFLSITLLFSIVLMIIPSNAYAEEIDVKSFAFEDTTIIELTNNSDKEVNTFRIWLGSDFSFKSFKTEEGWVGEKTPQGVIIFTSSETIKPGESVKFGVKTDKAKPGINWKALDKVDEQMNTGKVLPGELQKVVQNTLPKQDQTTENTDTSISTESIFRVIPTNVTAGSSIRVTGDQFGASQEFDFYIDSKKIGSFDTDENGHFMTTMKIPKDQKPDRVDFKVKDKKGEEKSISLRINDLGNLIPESQNIKLTIKGHPNVVHRGDSLEIFGTGNPSSAITLQINNPDGKIVQARTVEIDPKGNWKLKKPIIVPLDAKLGRYNATITDGRESILKHWIIESDKTIIITPSSLKFEPGEIMRFNGTALPNKPIEIRLEDPFGKEVFSDIIQVNESGFIEFEYPTTTNSIKGTYTMISTQEKEKEFNFVGVGELPSIPVKLEFDKLNYKAGEEATISLIGKGSDVVSLLILDPSDKPTEDVVFITLQPDGRGSYSLNLEGFTTGIYTAVVSKGNAKSTEIFAVGLQVGSGNIEINTTKSSYLPGDSILILGDTGANVLLTISLIDPDGNEVKVKESFSDKNGKISEGSFRIPGDGKAGMWAIIVKSGSNFDTAKIEVLATLSEGIQVTVEKVDDPATSHLGKQIKIKVTGASQSVGIEIIAEDGEIIESLSFPASAQGEINQPWIIPKDTEPGMYTIKVSDASGISAETTFVLE